MKSSDWRPLAGNRPGEVQRFAKFDGNGGLIINAVQDTTKAIDTAKAMRTHNDGYNKARDMRRVAHIPDIIAMKWLWEEGLNIHDPAHADRLMRKLNDPDWQHLRTADGRLGMSNGVMR